jgi:Flp pilus assembly pilin Flp
MKSKTKAIKVFLGEEQGPTTVEYAIMLAMIIGICIVAVVYMTGP